MDYAGCTYKLKASILMENLSSSQRKAPLLETERGFLAAAASFAMWRLGSVTADSSISAVPWCVGANLQISSLPCTPSTPRPHEPSLSRRRQVGASLFSPTVPRTVACFVGRDRC